jgi:hypothetical protein
MSDKSTSSLDILKRELSRLTSFTDEIGKSKDSAVKSREAADAAIKAAEAVHEQQKALLADLRREHQKSIDGQSELLRNNSQKWVEALEKQLAVALQEYGKQTAQLETVAESLRKDGQKQGDVLTTVSDRLQVITGSLTAFRDAMNAAKFSDRLESIDSHQHALNSTAQESHQNIVNRLNAFELLIQKQEANTNNQLAEVQQQIAALGSRNTIFQALLLLGIATLIALHFIK